MVSPGLNRANKVMIENQLGMKQGDEMLIPTTVGFLDVAQSAQMYANSIGVKAYIVQAPPVGRGEPLKALQSMANEVDGIYGLGGGFNNKEALQHGARVLSIIAGEEPIVRTVGNVDALKIKEQSWKIAGALNDGNTLKITCRNGSNFTEDISEKLGSPAMLWAGDPWECVFEFAPIGYPGYMRHPPLGTCNGTLVFDFWPPLGILNTPIKCTIEKDVIVKAEGSWEASKFWEMIKNWPERQLAELGLGINPNARIVNYSGPEWERYKGCIHFGLGSIMPYPAYGENGKLLNPDWKPATNHTDGMLIAPTLMVDDKVICKDGVLQPPFD